MLRLQDVLTAHVHGYNRGIAGGQAAENPFKVILQQSQRSAWSQGFDQGVQARTDAGDGTLGPVVQRGRRVWS